MAKPRLGEGEPVPPGQDERSFRGLCFGGTNIRARWLPEGISCDHPADLLSSTVEKLHRPLPGRVFREGDLGRLSELYLHLNILVKALFASL